MPSSALSTAIESSISLLALNGHSLSIMTWYSFSHFCILPKCYRGSKLFQN